MGAVPQGDQPRGSHAIVSVSSTVMGGPRVVQRTRDSQECLNKLDLVGFIMSAYSNIVLAGLTVLSGSWYEHGALRGAAAALS